METTHQNIHLTAAEMGSIWTAYVNDSLSVCIMRYFMQHTEIAEVRRIVEKALALSIGHLDRLRALMEAERFPVPVGFGEQDVDLTAPRAFQDTFYLMYIRQMSKAGLLAYGGLLALMARTDLIQYFKACLAETAELYEAVTVLSNQKGVHVRPPYMDAPARIDFIESNAYLGNLIPFFGKDRPLNAIEISHLFTNVETNLLGSMLSTMFAQMAKSQEVTDYMIKGREMAQHHLKTFAKTLIDSDVQAPMSWDTSVTSSTTPAFSEKLMMYHMTFLSAIGIGNYGVAASASMRMDVAEKYVRLSAEIAKYAKDGADIMIKHQWMEEPPQAPDREALAQLNK